MINLDSILKSRDITWPTKVRLVKAMVFPVVMYGCESWTVKKAECLRLQGRNINNLRYAEDTTLMEESKEELKNQDESERAE